jgi:MOSC domain-containing protein YiiM
MIPITLFTGRIAPLPGSGRPTGMFKVPLQAPAWLGPEGLDGDEQADRRVHGGPDKAVHLYPAGHYARLASRFPQAATELLPGNLGENISCAALSEADVCVGAVFQLGEARLQICQPRSPCWKIDDRFAAEGMAAYIAEAQLTGWYFRVVQPGRVSPHDSLTVVDPASGAPTLAEALSLWQEHRPAPAALRGLASCPGIAAGWQRKIAERARWLESHALRPEPDRPPFHVKPEAP